MKYQLYAAREHLRNSQVNTGQQDEKRNEQGFCFFIHTKLEHELIHP